VPLTASDTAALSAKSNLVSLLPEIKTEDTIEFVSRKGMSDDELFSTYYRSAYGAEPQEALKTLFLETLNEVIESEK
jgi:hypothetical protein